MFGRLSVLLIVLPFRLFAQFVVVEGKAPSYKHDELIFYKYSDYITFNEIELARARVAEDGTFRAFFSFPATSWVYLKAGIFKGILIAEPDSAYQIELPQKAEKTLQDILNPFFEAPEFFIQTFPIKPDRLTNQINEFEYLYNQYLNQNYLEVYHKARKSDIDTVIQNIEKLFSSNPNPFFFQHRHFRYAALRNFAYQRNDKFVIREYFLHHQVEYFNKAYFDLFNKLFEDYFELYAETQEGSRLFSDIEYSKSPYRIKQSLANNLALASDTLQELVILKGLHDAFYKSNYNDAALFQISDSMLNSVVVLKHAEILKQIQIKVCQLRKNFPAPDIILRDKTGRKCKLSDLKNKNIYLNFFRIESFTCQQDLALLQNLYKKIGNQVEIVTINCGPGFEKLQALFKEQNYDWTLLQLDTPEEAEKYKIKTYPSYFFIGADGKLIYSPSPGPGENFEFHYFNYLKSLKK